MARRVNIIKSLEMMGYSVLELETTYLIALNTGSGLRAGTSVSKEQVELDDFIVEEIVRCINNVIQNDLLGVDQNENRRTTHSRNRASSWI